MLIKDNVGHVVSFEQVLDMSQEDVVVEVACHY
jgi:hypothetical protein